MAPPYPQKLHFQSLLPGSTLSPFDVSPTLNLASPIVNRLEAKDQTYQLMFRSRGIARKDRRRLRRFERKGSKRKLFSWIGWPLDFEFRHLKRSYYPLISRPIGFEVSDTESRQQAHEYTQVTSKREEKKRNRSFLKRELSLQIVLYLLKKGSESAQHFHLFVWLCSTFFVNRANQIVLKRELKLIRDLEACKSTRCKSRALMGNWVPRSE